jgi:branched-chain amino acid transport system ATP-binding protein
MTPLLETRDLSKTFGGLKAVQKIDLRINANRIVSVIGPNGAGKTTFFNCLSGIYRPDGGSVSIDGRDITGRAPHEVCRLGLARTFQNIRLFPEMSVLENVLVAQFQHRSLSPLPLLFRSPHFREQENENRQEALTILEFVGLQDKADLMSGNLAYGQQRRLEIARALATKPRLLLLDEPAAGMNPQEALDMVGLISRIRERGLAILLIEHHMKVVMAISDEILVLDHGVPIAHGAPDRVRQDPASDLAAVTVRIHKLRLESPRPGNSISRYLPVLPPVNHVNPD